MAARAPLSLAAMRAIATGLLVLMAAIFIAARMHEDAHPLIGYIRAFAEAAMIGALADWFAVTALFRHPLGLPIPHTAIVPKSKARIGAGLASFLQSNFLNASDVETKLQGRDLSLGLARWLAVPARRALIADSLVAALPQLVALLENERVAQVLRDAVTGRLRALDLATLLADALEMIIRDGRHQAIVEPIVRQLYRLLLEQEPELRARMKQSTGWFWRTIGADTKAADGLLIALRDELAAMTANPDHNARQRLTAFLAQLADDLRTSDSLRANIDTFKNGFIAHESIRGYVDDIFQGLRQSLAHPTAEDETRLRAILQDALADLAGALETNADLRASLNGHLSRWLVRLVDARGPDIARLVQETVESWDAQTVVDRIEAGVGKDLQYIRINGTLVGGLVGVVIHAVGLRLF